MAEQSEYVHFVLSRHQAIATLGAVAVAIQALTNSAEELTVEGDALSATVHLKLATDAMELLDVLNKMVNG